MDKDQQNKKKSLLNRKQGDHFKTLHLLWVFFPPGRWRAKEIITWERRREETSTPVVAAGAPPPFSYHNRSIPQGKVWQRERDKGRRERERKEEIVGEIYRPLQQLTEGWVNLWLIVCTQNKLDWRCWKALRGFQRRLWASCEHKQTTTYLPWWHRTISVCRMCECKQQQQQQRRSTL